MAKNPISATVDFEADGIQHGHLRLPYSHDASAWGSIMIPITVAKNGKGPTALLTGGNHGDEYEGPIALMDLARSIDLAQVTGRVIIYPMMNYPAFRAGKRTSPIDGGNMNRVFPGKPGGSVTEKIADFIQTRLLPLADYVLDIHSGGKTLNFVPFAAAHYLDKAGQQDQCVAAMQAFNAPYSLMLREIDAVGMYDSAAEEMGKVFVSTELGGGGWANATTAAIAKKGVSNFLKHAGILKGKLEVAESISLGMPSDDCFVVSEGGGLIDYRVDLGDAVKKGDLIAEVYDVERAGRAPQGYQAKIDGIFAGRHFPGLIAMGDVVGVIAVPDSQPVP